VQQVMDFQILAVVVVVLDMAALTKLMVVAVPV
jgi:hypothetical protein